MENEQTNKKKSDWEMASQARCRTVHFLRRTMWEFVSMLQYIV